ncbi:hypothetical protein DV702_01605 [Sporosarcina sp. PTS2304]|uniref:UPF0738 family protein n=1 Tax=Sporosarcina sp. PTS2304 TaxID=2283194 RepID=UPI000E0D4DC4|nr:hypothetical protein [Sporosarcina sp. PTS2304]AXH98518.1 hypothetical protein DV702_01605 [Sporosarcina sp. PTS2304]
MDKQNKILTIDQQGNEIHFVLHPEAHWPLGSPTGKMLTDTDRQSFVYAFDHESGYRYAYFPQNSWSGLANVLLTDATPVLVWQDQKLVLTDLKDELYALVLNIEGNDNYGEKFSAAVEEAFQAVLEQVN